MEKKPLISIIVPYYNPGDQLKRCVSSLAGQSYRNLEILLINDGSDDGSPDAARSLAASDNRIIPVDIPHSGVSVARNTGLLKASGDLIMFVDSDDWMNTDIVECMLKTMQETEADIVTCELERTDEYRVLPLSGINEYEVYTQEEYLRLFFKIKGNLWVHFPVGKLCRRDLIPSSPYPESIRVGEDVVGTYLIISNAVKIVRLKEIGYYYYTNPMGVTTQFTEKDFDLIKVWDQMVEMTEGKEPDHSYAVINRNRINFTLLFRMITEVPAREIREKYSAESNKLLADLRNCQNELMRSPIVFSRKILIFILCHFYRPAAFFGNLTVAADRLAGRKSGFSRRKLS